MLPCYQLTWKLITGLERLFDSGGRFLISHQEYEKLKIFPKGDGFFAACIILICSTGLRPIELTMLTAPCFHFDKQPFVKTVKSKFRPNGRRVDLSSEALQAVRGMMSLSLTQKGRLCPQTKAFMMNLQDCLRRLLASDPSNLPMLTLYSCRHFYASNMWRLGVSSAWLMSQMSHKSWETTKVYVHTCDGKIPKWRNAFVGDPTNTFLPLSATLAPPLDEPGATERYLSSTRKFSHDSVEEASFAIQEDACEALFDGMF